MPNQINRDIYVKKNKIKEPIDYVKNTNAIPIVFNFRDYEIPSGATAQVFVQKPSKKSVYDDAAISGNSVSVDVKTQMMAEVGFANMQIQITQGEENLVTFDQPIRVYENRTDPDAPQSENESSFFEQLQEAAESANQAAQTANDAAQDIQQRAEEGEFSSTISIGNTTTGAPGTQAQVTNTGTDKDPVFNFTIPQGPQGPQGPAGNIDDLEDATVTFNQASTRTNINSGDSVATLFGKIKKWFADLGTAAFQGVSNVLTQTSSGYVLDARQGKTLADRIGTLSSLLTAAKTSLVSAVNELFNKIGDLDDLNTTEKDDIVGAINETNASLSDLSSKLSEEELIQDGLSVCTDVHAAVSGGSPKEVMFYQYGKTLNMRLNMHFSASIAQYGVLFRLPSELRPKIPQLFINNNGNVFSINSESGAISPQQSIPSGTWLQISMSYLLA